MASSKSMKSSSSKPADIEKIQSDVASFASSLGLASSLPSSGFNDSDFRPRKNTRNPKQTYKHSHGSQKLQFQKPKSDEASIHNPKSRKPNWSRSGNNESAANNFKPFEKFKNFPKLPLVKASALGAWHADEGELEEKVLGEERKKVEIANAEEWKKLVEKKKELGERLLVQYTLDYEASKGQSGDIKMLITTQRSGTAADKVSAYSVLIGDNPIANMRSLDALLGTIFLSAVLRLK